MSVPLDRLYHYLDDFVNHDLVIYRWAPHGSRKLEDLCPLVEYSLSQYLQRPGMVCHDQEPLIFEFYTQNDIKQAAKKNMPTIDSVNFTANSVNSTMVFEYYAKLGFRGTNCSPSKYDLTLLLHSEQQSSEVEQFAQTGAVPVYYWSHGLIACDWFRYAKHDPKLKYKDFKFQKDFLVYNRAWSGTREYRLKFVETLIDLKLLPFLQMHFNPFDGGHYTQHQFVNNDFQISRTDLETHIPLNTASACASANYVNDDYVNTGIEVVLETLFDDSRWHLTEKTLRPIACGKPFMLAGTANSLQYLQNYGFETFGKFIDESYDGIKNNHQRLNAITKEMQRISALDSYAKQKLFEQLHIISQRNQQHFFNDFFQQVVNEYKTNFEQAMKIMQQNCTGKHINEIKKLLENN